MSDTEPEVPVAPAAEGEAEQVPTGAEPTPTSVPASAPAAADRAPKTDVEILIENDLPFVGISPNLALKPASHHREPVAPSE